jgi:hypothetical protein
MLKEYNSSKGRRNAVEMAETPMGKNIDSDYLSGVDGIQRKNAEKINNILNEPHGLSIDWFEPFFSRR